MALLIGANIGYYLYNNWGLVTVKVQDAPLSQVIRSIEWQGWVKIYTNLPLDTKVTMFVDHVPLAEAMETLAANVDVPPSATDGDDSTRPNRPGNGGGRLGGLFGGAGTGGPGGTGPTAGGAATPGGPAGGGGGGFNRRAEWNLAFFIAPTSTLVKQEIREFQTGDPNDDNKVFSYGTQVQMIASDTVTTAPDPRLQAWPGVKTPDPSAPAAPTDAQANAAPAPTPGNSPTDPPAPPPTPVQLYLQDFAQSSNIWIMAPGSWTPDVVCPPPDSSIIHAVENFVSSSHGAVTEAIILRVGRGGARAGAPVAVAGGDDAWADRMRNAINGLPPDEKADAMDQITKEVQFRKDLRNLPADQRQKMMLQHFAERMLYGDRSRMSPEKRAKSYQRMIALRQAAKAQK